MDEIIFIVSESAEGGYEAKALAASVFTEADTMVELRAAVKDAVACHFAEDDRPKMVRLHFVKDEVFAI